MLLQKRNTGFTDFQIDYQISPVRPLEWLRGIGHEFSVTLRHETTEQRFAENLEIQTRDLQPGNYRLQFKITDNRSGQQAEREIGFRIVERRETEISEMTGS